MVRSLFVARFWSGDTSIAGCAVRASTSQQCAARSVVCLLRRVGQLLLPVELGHCFRLAREVRPDVAPERGAICSVWRHFRNAIHKLESRSTFLFSPGDGSDVRRRSHLQRWDSFLESPDTRASKRDCLTPNDGPTKGWRAAPSAPRSSGAIGRRCEPDDSSPSCPLVPPALRGRGHRSAMALPVIETHKRPCSWIGRWIACPSQPNKPKLCANEARQR